MSATINANDLKFTIFGSGNDYTLVNSGVGDMMFFSHPFVPLGSSVCAGQFLLYAPVYNTSDETAEPTITDVVQYDMSHCTFTPALGSTFDAEGEVEVKLAYHREYVYDDTIITVDKELTQKITVVNHGTVVTQDFTHWVYSDGYCFIKPSTVWVAEQSYYTNENQRKFTKCSCIPWRANSLRKLLNNSQCVDISELAYADTSQVQNMEDAFSSCEIIDFEPIKDWDVSSCYNFKWCFAYDTASDLTPISNWKIRGITVFRPNGGADCTAMFYGMPNLVDLSGLANLDTSYVTNMSRMFEGNTHRIVNLTPLANWNTSRVTDMSSMFKSVFNAGFGDMSYYPLLKSIDGLEDWDVSSVTNFSYMFAGNIWLDDISAIADWDMSNAQNLSYMFQIINVRNLTGITLDLSSATNMSLMFGQTSVRHSTQLDKDILSVRILESGSYVNYWADAYGNLYATSEVETTPQFITANASNASTWTVLLTNAGAFVADTGTGGWTNIPSWN